MASLKLGSMPAMKRQYLLAEFVGLKQACPSGVFVSITPGDASLWSGVIFVRKGPYATAVLRFQVSFPDAYPALPPLVTFSTDMFHPLITPLTTYMYTTDIQDNGTVSATDEERLPPGGFSLRHGFPDWFGRRSRSRQTSGQHASAQTTPQRPAGGSSATASATATPGSQASVSASVTRRKKEPSTYDVLRYLRRAFDDEALLDAVPLEAAGNPGAWHAWRTHRRQAGKVFPGDEAAAVEDGGGDGGNIGGNKSSSAGSVSSGMNASARRPGEWDWDGVWVERSRRNIAASLSEAVLYGSAGVADDVINFLNLDDAEIEGVKAKLLKTFGTTT